MDKYEYKLKLDELRELFQLKNYKAAADLADEINWQKVRNAKTLCMVADIYEAVERYDACQEVLMQAYDHSSVGRNIVGRLTEIAIKSKDVASAEEYYNEFLELAPRDTESYVFAYKIACLKNAPLEDRIAILEEFKEKEYSEMWAYELAVLYAQAGMREKCVETCDELILWFGDGEYVERALDLKRSFQPLTPSQEEKYQKFRSQKGMVEINIPQKAETDESVSGAEDIPAPDLIVTATKFNTQNLQDEIAKSMQQIMDATEENTVRDQLNSIKKIVQDIPYLEGEEEVSSSQREKIQEEVDEELKTDFQEKLVEETAYGPSTVNSEGSLYADDTSGMSIEEILADWEKTKAVAEEAMAAAEQKKLDLEKEQALAEANDIMRRLQELMPILSATPGEDFPDPEDNEGTVADELLSAEPIDTTPQSDWSIGEPKIREDTPFYFADEEIEETLPEDQAVTSPLQQVFSRATNRPERSPQDRMADVESLEEWDEESEIPDSGITEAELNQAEEIERETEDFFDDEEEFYELEEEGMKLSGEQPADTFTQPADTFTQPEQPADTFTQPEQPADNFEEDNFADDGFAADSFANDSFANDSFAAGGFVEEEFSEDNFADDFAADYAQAEASAPPVALSDDIQDIFSYFIPIPGMAEQISVVLGNTVKIKSDAVTSSQGNVIVQGEEGSGKTILATDLIQAARKTMGREDDKIGKITADALNTKNFDSLIPKIAGGYLIIEDAGNLNPDTVAAMSQTMDQDTGGMTVILEDDSAGIRRVMGLNQDFAAKFTEKIKIPIFTIDELVDFGKAYALEQECEIEEMAVLALYNRINNIQKLDHPTTLTEVKEIVDQAIDNAESGGIKKLFAKKYNEEDYLILHEEDFDF